ncbi:MAG: bifunctional folylpolyglutamate synthase/dihydrofolate synthase [Bacillota bacterium]
MKDAKRYREALNWIHELGRFGIKPGLERITILLDMLGNPHHQLRFVHIGGTNGKGSTAAMLASILRSAGYSIGLYTSPYLLSFTNRMAVDGADIGHDQLVKLVDQIRPLVDKISSDEELGPLTEFEVVTALALTYFAHRKVDLVVLEVGLGGRLDATNVVTPLLSIITNISLEHTEVLGSTVEAIAAEKAGIIKQGRPLLTAAENRRALTTIEEHCNELDSPYYRIYPARAAAGEIITEKPVAILQKITTGGQYFSYRGFLLQLDDIFIPLRGTYQLDNAATALAAVELLDEYGFNTNESAIRSGLANTNWPGRLEVLREKPLLIMDGAHNPAAIEKLAEDLPRYFNYEKLILVIGMLADKDTAAMLEHILPRADVIIFTRPILPRAADPAEIAAFAVNYYALRDNYMIIQNHGEALEKALEIAAPGDAVLVTGSLYTVSDIRAYWQQSKV